MDFFLKEIEHGDFVTWDSLINDVNRCLTYNPYCRVDNYYGIFKHLITSLILGKEIILLDSDFTHAELINLTGFSDFEEFTEVIDSRIFTLSCDKSAFIDKLRNTPDSWKITLFTSGTTGIPKKVTHNFNSITRFVKGNITNSKNVWGFAYNPTHMAGVQVFFQAILNGNTIVRLFGLNPKQIHKIIKENSITHISATPTFYRLLLPSEDIFQSVVRITSGGEKFNEKTAKQLSVIFPNAKITNVYASTEAGTLLASENDIFEIKPEYEHLIRIVDDELLIHNSLMGSSDLNIDEWYKTCDLIEIITDIPLKFRFISRKSNMINVGGYKVNPIEVEEIIMAFPGVKNVIVYSKSNSLLGNIVCCDVVRESSIIDESSIRVFLQSRIQEYKIPRIISFVDEILTTRTGKIKRY